ncbi:hypothetical protein AQUCO_00500077v1 [Aquilegia coerulea]|uniref:Senescence regulator n=1 Tax=Aquilegia coerulea TaxID=218851 RepID=A0A2G5EQ93_AQUCA|nr:hypothetical protein AQUCO_00500077v1 [Aquilegia coerulea]PIA57912.1 hypothetical protein AQUCO_00500077v1 [Aquilegia coerulea]
MAKGRKVVVSSRPERFLGYNQNHVTSTDTSELGEEDVWSMIDDAVDHIHHTETNEWSTHSHLSENNRSHHHHHHRSSRSQRWLDKEDHHIGGLSLAFDDIGRSTSSRIVHQYHGHGHGHDHMAPQRGRHVASSAPVNVPNWSKIYRVDSIESIHDSDDGTDDYNSERVPPHEYLARSRNSAATSAFVGVGRTLKGRDMSRVRDAVWSQTGFDG